MKKATNQQIIRFHTLASKLGCDDDAKISLVKQYTNNRETSTKQMEDKEIHRAISFLQKEVKDRKSVV